MEIFVASGSAPWTDLSAKTAAQCLEIKSYANNDLEERIIVGCSSLVWMCGLYISSASLRFN